MIRFVILNNPKTDNLKVIKKVLAEVTSYNIDNDIVYFEEFDGSIEVLKNLSDDLFIDMIVSDLSECFLLEDVKWLKNLWNNANLRGFVLEKDILIKTLDTSEYTKKRVLKKNYQNFDILECIKKFLECNMNTSKASTVLYMHRNTMINKIEKFYQDTNYDPKCFKDAFILYNLIK